MSQVVNAERPVNNCISLRSSLPNLFFSAGIARVDDSAAREPGETLPPQADVLESQRAANSCLHDGTTILDQTQFENPANLLEATVIESHGELQQ